MGEGLWGQRTWTIRMVKQKGLVLKNFKGGKRGNEGFREETSSSDQKNNALAGETMCPPEGEKPTRCGGRGRRGSFVGRSARRREGPSARAVLVGSGGKKEAWPTKTNSLAVEAKYSIY